MMDRKTKALLVVLVLFGSVVPGAAQDSPASGGMTGEVWSIIAAILGVLVPLLLYFNKVNRDAHKVIGENIKGVKTELKADIKGVEGKVDGLGLPGRAKKIHEKVCRYGGHVPIRGVWHAGAMTGAVRWGLGLGGTPGTCASNTSNEKRRS